MLIVNPDFCEERSKYCFTKMLKKFNNMRNQLKLEILALMFTVRFRELSLNVESLKRKPTLKRPLKNPTIYLNGLK